MEEDRLIFEGHGSLMGCLVVQKIDKGLSFSMGCDEEILRKEKVMELVDKLNLWLSEQ